MKRFHSESGQTLVFVALAWTVLMGAIGFATDIGLLLYQKREMQTAADAAAIAGVAELNYANQVVAGQAASAMNGFTNGTNGTVVTVNTPPVYGNYKGLANYVEAIVSQPQKTLFMGFFQKTSMTVTVRAVAHWGNSSTCIVTLGTSGTDISVTSAGSNPVLNAPNCGISDDSTSATALDATSAGAAHPIVASSIGIAGGYSVTGGTLSPTPVTGIVPVSNPLAYLPTPVSTGTCLTTPGPTSGGNYTIPAGNYCSGLSITSAGGTITFATGTYYIGGSGMTITGAGTTINGTGVTFNIYGGGASITGAGLTFNVSAPTSGTYNGILFNQAASDTTAANITEAGSGSTFDGVLDFSGAAVTFTAAGTAASLHLAFVAKSLTITAAGSSINDYASLTGATSPFGAANLVE